MGEIKQITNDSKFSLVDWSIQLDMEAVVCKSEASILFFVKWHKTNDSCKVGS